MAGADEMHLRDEDRLPWLETVAPDERESSSAGRTIAKVVLGLALLTAILFAAYRFIGARSVDGDGQLIAAPEGPYKVRPARPGGLEVVGEGDAAVATSAGKGAGNGAIDLSAVPEAPITASRGTAAPETPSTAGRDAGGQVPESGGRLIAKMPMAARRGGGGSATPAGTLVQLGAYPSAGAANDAWAAYSKRFGYIAPLAKTVEPVEAGGRTLYRLRVDAGSAGQAANICGRLKVAGESCFVAG